MYNIKLYAVLREQQIVNGDVVDTLGEAEISIGAAFDSLLPAETNPKLELAPVSERTQVFSLFSKAREQYHQLARVTTVGWSPIHGGNVTVRLSVDANFVYQLSFFVRYTCPKTKPCLSVLPRPESSATEWALRFEFGVINAPPASEAPDAMVCVFFHEDPLCCACTALSDDAPMFLRLSEPKAGGAVSVQASALVSAGQVAGGCRNFTRLAHIGPVYTAPFLATVVSRGQVLMQGGAAKTPSFAL
jgi:hypothetical protein